MRDFLIISFIQFISAGYGYDFDRDQFAWLTPLKGDISKECLTASNNYVDDLIKLLNGETPLDLQSIPTALQMFDANGRLPVEGFLSDSLDMPIDICGADVDCMYTLPDQLRFVILKIPIGYAMNPGSMDECLGVDGDATTYCFTGMISPNQDMESKTRLANSPILQMNLPNISKLLKRIIKINHMREKLADQSEVAILADPDMIKNHIKDIGIYNVTIEEDIQNQLLLTMFSMYTAINMPRIGMCYPKACSTQDVNINFQNLTSAINNLIDIHLVLNGSSVVPGYNDTVDINIPSLNPNITIFAAKCYNNENISGVPDETPGVFIFFFGIFAVVGLLIVIGTTLELYCFTSGNKNVSPKSFASKLLISFSLYSNGKRFLSTEPNGKDHLDCMNGMRFISMTWVVLGHTFLIGFYYSTIRNQGALFDLLNYGYDFAFEAVYHGTPSVDSFFLMSGTLTTYIVLKELDKAGNNTTKHCITLVLYYLHRYLRLTIPYALIMGVIIAVLPYVYHGPLWYESVILESESCREYWYRHLLYYNTLVKGGETEVCMGVTWYLVDDMMFHVFSPIIIYPMYFAFKLTKKHVIGIMYWFVALFCFTFTIFYISYTSKLPPEEGMIIDNFIADYDYNVGSYVAPWFRYQPYLVGILLGYILHHLRGKTVTIREDINIFVWEAAFLCAFAVVYGLYNVRKTHQITLFTSTMYNTFQRMSWSLALAWVIFSCSKGYGGLVNEFLSWPVFAPLSRLTFTTYLIHMNVISMFGSSVLSSSPYDFTIWNTIWIYFAIQFVSCVVALVFVLAFEMPAMRVEKLLIEAILSSLVGNNSEKNKLENDGTHAQENKLFEDVKEGPEGLDNPLKEDISEKERADPKWIEANAGSQLNDNNSITNIDVDESSNTDAGSTETNSESSGPTTSTSSMVSSRPPAYDQLEKHPEEIQVA